MGIGYLSEMYKLSNPQKMLGIVFGGLAVPPPYVGSNAIRGQPLCLAARDVVHARHVEPEHAINPRLQRAVARAADGNPAHRSSHTRAAPSCRWR